MTAAERILRTAVPRLAREDEGAEKLRRALMKRARARWAEGPGALSAMGLRVEGASRLPKEDDGAALVAMHEALGDAGLATFLRALRDELAKAVAAKKESATTTAVARRETPEARAKRDALHDSADELRSLPERGSKASGRSSGTGALTISSHDETSEGEEAGGLAVPQDEEAAPLSIRFDDDAPVLLEAEVASAATKASEPAAAKGRSDDDDDETQAADRALSRFRSTGDPDELARARTLFARAAKAATTKPARGAARGGLALVTLLGGDAEKAREHAEKALALFPHEPRAIEVWLRAARKGEAAREQVRAALVRAERALASEDAPGAHAIAAELDEVEGGDAFAALLRLAALPDRDDPEEAIGAAWKVYPPAVTLGDLALGPAIERGVCTRCLDWVREKVRVDPGPTLTATVEKTEDKANVISGAVQLALGVARGALATRTGMTKNDEQELRLWEGQALLAAQYYDQAVEVLGQARRANREGPRALEAGRDEQQCGVMRRAFDKPGVKAKMGSLDGVGLRRRREALAARVQAVADARQALESELDQAEAALVVALLGDAARRGRVAARALEAGQDDPLARIAEVEASLGDLDAPAAGDAAPAAPAPGGGLFGRMKGGITRAFDAAKAAAVKAEHAVRRSVLDGKRIEAQKALGRRLRNRPAAGWGDADLDAHVDRIESIQPRLEALDEEATALREAVGRG